MPLLRIAYVSGVGSTDNALFSISDNTISTATSFNYESKSSYSILVRSTTQFGLSLDQAFIITINDVNEAPTLNAIANQTICFTTSSQSISLSGITAGPETGQTTTTTVSSSLPAMFSQLTTSGNTLSYTAANSGTATITITVKDNGGKANSGTDSFSQSFSITVNPLPVVTISSDLGTDISKGATTVLTASGGTSYSWANAQGIVSGQNISMLTVRPTVSTTYTVTAINALGCSSIQTITITVAEDYKTLEATNIMSPNGDGVNDLWVIKNIDMYPNNEVKVFDRAGRLVFSKKGYQNTWDANINNRPLAEDTYYYIVDFGNSKGLLKGFITIVGN